MMIYPHLAALNIEIVSYHIQLQLSELPLEMTVVMNFHTQGYLETQLPA